MKRRSVPMAGLLGLLAACIHAEPARSAPDDALLPWLRFHAGFEDTLDADHAAGRREPVTLHGSASFEAGCIGRALRIGAAAGGAQVDYASAENLDLTRPGGLSFWVAPRSWQKSSAQYLPFVRVLGKGSSVFLVERDVRNDGQERLIAGFFSLPGGEQHFLQMAIGPHWSPGSWHLIAVAWDGAGIRLSVDGGPWVRKAVPDGRIAAHFAETAPSWLVGNAMPEASLLDELAIYSRGLRDEDVAALWAARCSGAGARR